MTPAEVSSIDCVTYVSSDANRLDSRVIVGVTIGARSLIPTVTHAGVPMEGTPAGVAHVTVARRESKPSALPGSTIYATTAIVPKRHVMLAESALADVPVPKKNVAKDPPDSGEEKALAASRAPSLATTVAAAASSSLAPNQALH
tara:strand:+ start:3555 stop:3989 length:435 start_codon:yes stop_codon:yes gene_type:complete